MILCELLENMAFNSYVLVEKGMEAPDRAKLLGHSVETNLDNPNSVTQIKQWLSDKGIKTDTVFIAIYSSTTIQEVVANGKIL